MTSVAERLGERYIDFDDLLEELASKRECSKGWNKRCSLSRGPRCKCKCGGDWHGVYASDN